MCTQRLTALLRGSACVSAVRRSPPFPAPPPASPHATHPQHVPLELREGGCCVVRVAVGVQHSCRCCCTGVRRHARTVSQVHHVSMNRVPTPRFRFPNSRGLSRCDLCNSWWPVSWRYQWLTLRSLCRACCCQEDALLIEKVHAYGEESWHSVAQHFPYRTNKQCRDRCVAGYTRSSPPSPAAGRLWAVLLTEPCVHRASMTFPLQVAQSPPP